MDALVLFDGRPDLELGLDGFEHTLRQCTDEISTLSTPLVCSCNINMEKIWMISTCCSAVVSTSPRLPLDVEWCGLCESMVKAYNVEGDAPRAVGRESVARSRPFLP